MLDVAVGGQYTNVICFPCSQFSSPRIPGERLDSAAPPSRITHVHSVSFCHPITVHCLPKHGGVGPASGPPLTSHSSAGSNVAAEIGESELQADVVDFREYASSRGGGLVFAEETRVNGEGMSPIFTFLKEASRHPLPIGAEGRQSTPPPPALDTGPSATRHAQRNGRTLVRASAEGPWVKFLVLADGKTVKRYSAKTTAAQIGRDLSSLVRPARCSQEQCTPRSGQPLSSRPLVPAHCSHAINQARGDDSEDGLISDRVHAQPWRLLAMHAVSSHVEHALMLSCAIVVLFLHLAIEASPEVPDQGANPREPPRLCPVHFTPPDLVSLSVVCFTSLRHVSS